jgi:hypothetical protein
MINRVRDVNRRRIISIKSNLVLGIRLMLEKIVNRGRVAKRNASADYLLQTLPKKEKKKRLSMTKSRQKDNVGIHRSA